MAFILGCEILFSMLTYLLQTCTFWVVVPVYLFLPSGLQLVELPSLYLPLLSIFEI